MALIVNRAQHERRDADPPYPPLARGVRVTSLVEASGMGFPIAIGYQGEVIDQPSPDLVAVLFDHTTYYVYMKPDQIEPVDWAARRVAAAAGAPEHVEPPVTHEHEGQNLGVPECCASAKPGPPVGGHTPEGYIWPCPTCAREWVHVIDEAEGAYYQPHLGPSWDWAEAHRVNGAAPTPNGSAPA